MNQTKKRLSIINLAISINDIETTQLQVLKLSLLKTDSKIQDIIETLQAKNYAQAQGLIASYIKIPNQDVVQRSMQEEPAISPEDQALIDEFDLFVIPKKTQKKKKKVRSIEAVDVDSFLDINVDNVLSKNSEIQDTATKENGFFSSEEKEALIDTSHIPKDTFFDNIPSQEIEKEEVFEKEEIIKENKVEEEKEEKIKSILDDTEPLEKSYTEEEAKETLSFGYPPILHLEQKIISMKNLYPAIEQQYAQFPTVEALMHKLIHEYYTEKEIEETLLYAMKLIEQDATLEATQLILVCAATESQFAQFILGRELYKGTLFEKNTNEAFKLIQTLALKDYPEALCDLGQFYEYGIGTNKNKKKAEELYKASMELGIYRAKTHYERIKKENRSFFRR